jgi:hypothetical protein
MSKDFPWFRFASQMFNYYKFNSDAPEKLRRLNGRDNEIILDKSDGYYVYDTSFWGKEDLEGLIVLTNHRIVFLSYEGVNYIFHFENVENISSLKIRKFLSGCEFIVSGEKHLIIINRNRFIEAALAEYKKFR